VSEQQNPWPLVWLVAALVFVTSLLIVARLLNSPTTWPQVRTNLTGWAGGAAANAEATTLTLLAEDLPQYRLRLVEEFDTVSGFLLPNQQDGEWALVVDPAVGRYQMVIEQPNRLVWSTLGGNPLQTYLLEGSFLVADLTPMAATGFIARYRDRHNFYLFAVDGGGRWQVQLFQAGTAHQLTPWTTSPWLNRAGQSNHLALEENGSLLRFWANRVPLFEVDATNLPPGDVGVFGLSPPAMMGEMAVEWLRLSQ
jgi:hypothetical protein